MTHLENAAGAMLSLICALKRYILNFGMEMTMSVNRLNHLREEHARLEAEIEQELRRPMPDQLLVARLKKQKLAIKDRIRALGTGLDESRVA